MSRNFVKGMWTAAGVLLIIAGVICLGNPGIGLSVMAVMLGVFMLVSGVIDLVVYSRGRRSMYGSGWFLADGIVTILLSLFILFNQAFTTLTFPFVIGMWLIFSGITKLVNSFELQQTGVKGWGWFTFLGIVLALMGFLSFLDPVMSLLTLSFTVGFLMIVQGISTLARAFFTDRFFR